MVTRSNLTLLFVIAASMCLVFSSAMVKAGEPSITEALDKKSFKTVPFVSNPTDTQQRELERMVDQCVQTAEREVPGNHFSAHVSRGIVNTVGMDRGRFKFWKCMSENGQSLAPINK
ncbi:MAG: hypothetical protein L0H94_15255 [Nitrospira sp.]|nr:hypothetical protein [Nitrospira sp.]